MKSINAAACLFAFSLLTACQKQKQTTEPGLAQKFHKDIILHESVNGNEQPQNALGIYPLTGSAGFLFTASRGMMENEASGFRIGAIEGDEIAWIKSYSLPPSYDYQFATCSAMDQNQDVWIGGHIFGVPDSYGRPFLVKLDRNGTILLSKYIEIPEGPNKTSARGLSLKLLKNGDLAYLTITSTDLILYRINPQGTIVWVKSISAFPNIIMDDPFRLSNNVSSINKTLAESPQGDLYIAFTSKFPVKGKDVLVKLNSSGNLQFAKSYRYEDSFESYPAQIVCTSTGDIVYADHKWIYSSALPYLYLLSSNGGVLEAKGYPKSVGPGNPFGINELNYFNDQIHLTTTLGYQFADYTLDPSLAVIKSGKVLGSNIISTEKGGTSVYDSRSNSLYHIVDVAGALGDGNGFQFIKTDNSGASCHGYQLPPEELVLKSFQPTIQEEPSLTINNLAIPPMQPLSWTSAAVNVGEKQIVCSN